MDPHDFWFGRAITRAESWHCLYKEPPIKMRSSSCFNEKTPKFEFYFPPFIPQLYPSTERTEKGLVYLNHRGPLKYLLK